jgi:hypothetical protein
LGDILKIIILALVLAALISVPLPAFAKKYYTKAELLSPQTGETLMETASALKDSYTLTLPNLEVIASLYSIGTKREPRETFVFWIKKDRGYELAYKLESGLGELFSKPVLFTISKNNFVNISTEPNGSGGFVADQFLWFAPDGTVHALDFQQASEVYEHLAKSDEVILTGGEKEFFYDEDQMKFEFWLARRGDAHCCPSGGTVTGTYKLVGDSKYDSFTRKYKAHFQITVDHITPLPSK